MGQLTRRNLHFSATEKRVSFEGLSLREHKPKRKKRRRKRRKKRRTGTSKVVPKYLSFWNLASGVIGRDKYLCEIPGVLSIFRLDALF